LKEKYISHAFALYLPVIIGSLILTASQFLKAASIIILTRPIKRNSIKALPLGYTSQSIPKNLKLQMIRTILKATSNIYFDPAFCQS
jgi:hypothetical protein